MKYRIICALFLTMLMTFQHPIIAIAAEDIQEIPGLENEWPKVADATLAALRGGFVLPNGIIVGISFEKRIFQNEVLTYNSYFESPENFTLANNGEFKIAADLNNSILQSVIQNNLDDQTFKTINTLNISIGNLNDTTLTLSSSEFYTQHVLPNFSP